MFSFLGCNHVALASGCEISSDLLESADNSFLVSTLVCELFLFYLRGVLFARVIVSRNGNLYPFTNLHYFYSRQSGNYHVLYGIDRRNHNELHYVHLNTI